MSERELIILGFNSVSMGEHDEDESYYYALDVVNGLSFISSVNNEIKNDEWYVDVFNTEPAIRFSNFVKLQALLNVLNSAIVKEKI
jgi:hypothetical protein